jgi:hypothetical protein
MFHQVPLKGVNILIDENDFPAPPDAGILRQRVAAAIPPQVLPNSNGVWVKVVGAEVELKGVSALRGVKIGLSLLIGRDSIGMADLAVYRNGLLLAELSGTGYLQNNADVIPAAPFAFDLTHGGGDLKYEFYWRSWSGNTCTGGRYDGQYVSGRVGWCFAEEYQS